jgi:tetratricopeptide (TPR) repeat protein
VLQWKFICLSSLLVAAGHSEILLSLPEQSQRAAAVQRVGLTDITVTYHRPLVAGRKIWGGIVPYGQVWRAGANENTTIEFTDPVTVEGQPLARGIYGLHMIPGEPAWTVIFSKTASAWGSFTYDQAEDALRVTVKPQPSDMHEALTYDFDDLKPDSAVVTLRWEKLAVPVKVSADVNRIALQHVRDQLRGGLQYTWEGWDEAASYCLAKKIDLDEGLRWADRSIQVEERFDNLITRAQLLEALNRGTEAAASRNRAIEIGNVTQLYFYGRGLQSQNHQAEAMELFKITAKRFPEHWLGHMATARLASAAGDYGAALKEVKTVQGMGVPEQQKANLENLARRLEAKEDINR